MLSEMQSRLKASVWRAIAQSGVDVSGLPQDQLDKLVQLITTNVLTEIDSTLTESVASGGPVNDPDDDDEKVLWEGRPFLSLSTYYIITSERVRIVEGIFGKERRDIELVRIQDIDHKQNLTERTLNIGDIFIASHDRNDPHVVLNNVPNPTEVHEILRRATLSARKKYNVGFREEM
ncbi:MAG: hypothetical protein FOGNACKC_04809 [Anaerolineae bacterium]|nr:hypothetical protein [Anaerolineae bacterium]